MLFTVAASLVQLLEQHDEEVRRVLTRRLGCVEAAADILQETYRRLAHRDLWRDADNPRALMYRIALNLATDHERRLKTQGSYLCDEVDPELLDSPAADPAVIAESRERLERLGRAVEGLPPRCRQVFLLRKIEDLSHAEIADRLGLSRSSVEKHLRNALQALHDAVDD